MDTPERNQIGTPLSKFEDSPVFNYINSLSPIKPVKSIHITQTFSSLSFTSPPSVFTSPHVSYPKESRFLRRHCFPETKPDSSERRHEHNTSGAILDADQVCGSSAGPPEIAEKGTSIEEGKVDHTLESSELAIELPRTLKYDCGSPEGAEAPNNGTKAETVLIISETPEEVVRFVQETTVGHHSFESCTGLQVQNTCQHEQTKEEIGCDWENLISDTSDLLAFDSPNEVGALKPHDNKLVDPQTSLMLEFPPDTTDSLQKTQPVVQVDPHEHDEMENPAGAIQEVGEQKETDHTPHVLPNNFQNKNIVSIPSEKVDDKASGNFINVGCKLRGIRRRCLVFESASAQKKKLGVDSSSCSSVSSHSEEKAACDDKSLVPIRTGSSSSPCILPGIGLHLNALAASTKDLRVVKHETVTAGKQLISIPSSSTSFHSLSSERKSCKSLALSSIKTDVGPAGNIQIMQDASRASAFKVGEDFSESSPKKKRRRLEQAGESESACKRCNCKKSKCLKLYCECFAAGVYCVEPCSCQDCFNKPVHEDTVLATRKQIESRNPLAFAPKVIRSSESNAEIGEESNKTPASARHKRGCNCKKSSCLKKYCECYQGGVGCSINCRCEGCKNAFGRKDGSTPLAAEETEPEEEEMETSEKVGVDKSSQNSEVHNSEEQYPDHVLPITFSFQICRTSVQMPLSIGKPPQSSLPPQPRFEKHFQIVPDDETPEILRNCSPISGVKTSPNCKRVSPPHNDFVSSPGRRSSRKLILRSIPAFPSLSDHETSDFQ